MAYNNGLPVTYSNYPLQAPYLPLTGVPTPQTSISPITWVQGENGAKSYLVAPNSTAVLFDSEAQVVYIKTADATGMPSIKTLDYTIRDAAQVPKSEIDEIKEQIAQLRRQYESLVRTDESAE